jgi:predicted RNase H-like HicB family nuclease
MKLTAILTPAPEGGFVAYNPETGTSSQGETEAEALSNIREATELYLEEFPDSIKSQPITKTFELMLDA